MLWQEYRQDARYCTVVSGILTATPAVGGFTAAIASGGHPNHWC
ncbi:hypothetical protein NKG94_00655 [Micromonospora sp. M12]